MKEPAESASSGQPLPDALASLGYEQTSRLGAASWRGLHEGREAAVTVNRQSRTKYAGEVRYRKHLGYRLRIDLETAVRTRLFFVKQSVASNRFIRWIYRLRKQAVVEQVPPELNGFQVVTVDEGYAERLLAETDAMADVAHLLHDAASSRLVGSVYLQPGTVHYGSPILPGDSITTDRVVDVLRRLDEIARAAERIEPPTVASQLSRFELFAKHRPVAAALVFLGGCLGALALVGLLFAGALGAAAYLLAGPG